ncbi:EF hand, partial [Cooperia oncophora]
MDKSYQFPCKMKSYWKRRRQRNEFAQAMGMKETDMFVQRMFAVTAQSNSDVITFAQFLEVLKKFSGGTMQEKYKLLFSMCDVDGSGRVHRREFADLIRSLNTVVGVSITESTQNRVIESILDQSGIEHHSDYLTTADFEAIFTKAVKGRPVGVELRGAKLKMNLEETASLNSFAVPTTSDDHSAHRSIFGTIAAFTGTYRQHIFILFIFCCVNLMIFWDRFRCEFITAHSVVLIR